MDVKGGDNMAGICNSCVYFRKNMHPGEEKPHHCAYQNVPLSEEEANQNCDECVPRDECKSCE
jgi:hypothetical protein